MTFILTTILRSLIRRIPGLPFITAIFVIFIAAGIFLYIFYGLGLSRIARNRSVRFPYLAWVPIASLYVLGACADDERGRRRYAVLCPVFMGTAVILQLLATNGGGSPQALPVLLTVLSIGMTITAFVFFYMALYWTYASLCRVPAPLLVLSILFAFLIPIFLYSMRENLPGGGKRVTIDTKGD